MKNYSALAPLTREHALALEVSQALGVNASAELRSRFPSGVRARRDALGELAQSHFLPHFIFEEQLFEAHARGHSQRLDGLLLLMRAEHRALRAELGTILRASEPTDAQFGAFAERFERHVRFEEEELLPMLDTLPLPAQEQLERALAICRTPLRRVSLERSSLFETH